MADAMAETSSANRGAGVAQAAPMAGRALKSLAKEDRDDKVATGEQQAQINLRQNFDALALCPPNGQTHSNGKAVVEIKLPDNLTRYRITAVSVDTCSSLWARWAAGSGRGGAPPRRTRARRSGAGQGSRPAHPVRDRWHRSARR